VSFFAVLLWIGGGIDRRPPGLAEQLERIVEAMERSPGV
jgi:hypothetical protein